MTGRKILHRMAALLLCAFLCLGMALSTMAVAYAAGQEQAASSVAIEIMLPADWASVSAAAKVCVTDQTGSGFASVEVRIDRGGSWRDITASLEQRQDRYYGVVDITDNCTVYVRVTGHDGEVYENSRYMECFDRTPPTVRTSISGNALRVEASDDLSGVAQITVNGKGYADLSGGTLEVPLKDLGTAEKISVQAADRAGNKSQTAQVTNPNYQAPSGSVDSDAAVQKPVAITPVKTPDTAFTPSTSSPAASTTTPLDGTNSAVTDPNDEAVANSFTPDGQGTVVDNVTDADSKEFFTFTTPGENTFYLVIDRDRESENVYFLNAVTESDLYALAEKDEEQETPDVSAIPDPEPVCNCVDKCVSGAVNTECPVCVLSLDDCAGKAAAADMEADQEPDQPEDGGNGTIILVVIAALAVGGVGYYLKIYKPKHDLDAAEDFDDLTGEDEETVNEDEDEPTPRRSYNTEPEEPDYPDGYGYEEPEDEK